MIQDIKDSFVGIFKTRDMQNAKYDFPDYKLSYENSLAFTTSKDKNLFMYMSVT